MRPFINQRDVHMRLDGCIAMFRGIPVKIRVNNNDPLHTIKIECVGDRNAAVIIDSMHPDLELNHFNIGYMNQHLSGKAVWVTRQPARSQKQGLCSSNIRINGAAPSANCFLEMGDMLTNNYPSYITCKDLVGNRRESWAFNSKYCLGMVDGYNKALYNQGRLIALHDHDDYYKIMPKLERMRSFYMMDLEGTGVQLI